MTGSPYTPELDAISALLLRLQAHADQRDHRTVGALAGTVVNHCLELVRVAGQHEVAGWNSPQAVAPQLQVATTIATTVAPQPGDSFPKAYGGPAPLPELPPHRPLPPDFEPHPELEQKGWSEGQWHAVNRHRFSLGDCTAPLPFMSLRLEQLIKHDQVCIHAGAVQVNNCHAPDGEGGCAMCGGGPCPVGAEHPSTATPFEDLL